MLEISDLPALIARDARRLKPAIARAVNHVAFESQKLMVKEAQSKLKFRVAARQSLGLTVDKATPQNQQAAVLTRRKWLQSHLKTGSRKVVKSGWRMGGKDYLIIPYLKIAFTKQKRLKAGYLKGAYSVPKGAGGLLFYRAQKKDKQSQLIAILTPTARTTNVLDWDKIVARTLRTKGTPKLRALLKRRA